MNKKIGDIIGWDKLNSANETVYIPECIDHIQAINILTNELLGENYICCDSLVGGYQANAMIIRDILAKYKGAKVEILTGKVYGGYK